jgi:pimeloyl-ACP methyl ester carboxylesterase
MIAQNVAMQRPDLVRKLVIVGSGPRNGDGIPLTTESEKIFTNKYGNMDDSGSMASLRHHQRARPQAVRS